MSLSHSEYSCQHVRSWPHLVCLCSQNSTRVGSDTLIHFLFGLSFILQTCRPCYLFSRLDLTTTWIVYEVLNQIRASGQHINESDWSKLSQVTETHSQVRQVLLNSSYGRSCRTFRETVYVFSWCTCLQLSRSAQREMNSLAVGRK